MRIAAAIGLPGLVTHFSCVVLGTTSVAHAQVRTDVQQAPTLTIERYPEDWSRLADPGERTGHGSERFKYILLDEGGSTYLTTGIELRSRYEGYENHEWGALPDDDYVWHRAMPYADLHVGQVRLFAQPIVTAITGTDRPRAPVDTTGADMLQAFAEVDLRIAGTALRVLAGRKLISLGAGRLVDTRYGPNVPQAFDGLDATVGDDTRQLRALWVRPVETRPGDLNDASSSQKALWGVYATQWLNTAKTGGFDLYYLGLRDRHAVFDVGMGRQVVHSIGGRIFGDDERWHWNIEGVIQRGRFADGRVAACGVGGELGHRFTQMALKPELALTLDVISGDDDPYDRTLGTFNPLFPRGKYFAAQSPVGPRNLIHLQPSATLHPHRDVALSLTGVAYWRESTKDGLYNIPGILVRRGGDSDARFIGKQIELAVAWQATAELNLSASVSAFDPGRFIRETGPARVMRVAGAAATFRF
ncbi:alginate export family protein [Novosphingobium sp.]|uniref:alginate export family protein n=1 Tax=Novosphingobium sp. TaxID=1874826 RepID=UPI0028AE6AD7|nr:alginate export family protein [Novosphingobium sp.]